MSIIKWVGAGIILRAVVWVFLFVNGLLEAWQIWVESDSIGQIVGFILRRLLNYCVSLILRQIHLFLTIGLPGEWMS